MTDIEAVMYAAVWTGLILVLNALVVAVLARRM